MILVKNLPRHVESLILCFQRWFGRLRAFGTAGVRLSRARREKSDFLLKNVGVPPRELISFRLYRSPEHAQTTVISARPSFRCASAGFKHESLMRTSGERWSSPPSATPLSHPNIWVTGANPTSFPPSSSSSSTYVFMLEASLTHGIRGST